jgi:hypothetical protein
LYSWKSTNNPKYITFLLFSVQYFGTSPSEPPFHKFYNNQINCLPLLLWSRVEARIRRILGFWNCTIFCSLKSISLQNFKSLIWYYPHSLIARRIFFQMVKVYYLKRNLFRSGQPLSSEYGRGFQMFSSCTRNAKYRWHRVMLVMALDGTYSQLLINLSH